MTDNDSNPPSGRRNPVPDPSPDETPAPWGIPDDFARTGRPRTNPMASGLPPGEDPGDSGLPFTADPVSRHRSEPTPTAPPPVVRAASAAGEPATGESPSVDERTLRAAFGMARTFASVRAGVVGLDGTDPDDARATLLCIDGAIVLRGQDAADARRQATTAFATLVDGVTAGRAARVLRPWTDGTPPTALTVSPLELALSHTRHPVDAPPSLCPLPHDVVRWTEVQRLPNGTLVPLRVPFSTVSSPPAWLHVVRLVDRAHDLMAATDTSHVLLADPVGGTLVTRTGDRFGIGHVILGRVGIVGAWLRRGGAAP